MRRLADTDAVRAFLRELARSAEEAARVYLTGGATAVLLGWRPTTIDVDMKLVPEADALLRAIARLKDQLAINVELAAPSDFIPELPGWDGRSGAHSWRRKAGSRYSTTTCTRRRWQGSSAAVGGRW